MLKSGTKLCLVLCLALMTSAGSSNNATSGISITSWNQAKRAAVGIYKGREITVYCDCAYTSGGSGGMSGTIHHDSCGYSGPDVHSARADRMEWEHVVPASTLRGDHPVWQADGRSACERDIDCGAALFDLHNLAPSVGQVNAIRSNKPFQILGESIHSFGDCPIKTTRDEFEPPDCLKGDVARIHV